MQMDDRGGVVGEFVEVLPGLQGTVGYRDIVQISGKGAGGGGRRQAVSGIQPEEG